MVLRILRPSMVLVVLLAASGCRHVGPQTIIDDRVNYNDAVVESWKQQTLLNIVRIRYLDVPEFVDVPSVVNGYESARSGVAKLAPEFFPRDNLSTMWGLEIGGERAMVDRPTISYAPQSGSEFIRNLTHPLPPISILNLIESGNPADVVFGLAVDSINGIRNVGMYGGASQAGDPEFAEVIRIIKLGQASGHVSLRTVPSTSGGDSDVVLLIRSDRLADDVAAELGRLREILGLDPTVREFKVVFGTLPSAANEIAIRTRSVLRIMTYLALFVEVPAEHLADGRAPALGSVPELENPPYTVHSGCEPPCDAYTAVQYHGRWFWIDPRDTETKRTMIYLKILLALADTKPRALAPALTIQAN